ncbi:MAG: hypothetical protein ACLQVI_20295 [Polyangiaceae bacterium]
MSVATKFGLSLTALGTIGLTAVLVPACSSNENTQPVTLLDSGPASSSGGTTDGGDGGSGLYCGAAGQPCCAGPGQVPNPKCDDGDESSCATSTACSIQETASTPLPNGCGSDAPTSCEPMATNTGTTQNFRMRRIILVAPKNLATSAVQVGVVTNGVDLNEIECGEKGTGDFSWLLSFNTTANTLTTGGAPPCDLTDTPACDPYTTGYCFVHKTVTSSAGSIQVAPVTVATNTNPADGTLETAIVSETLNIPIYYNGSIIVLPISNGQISGMTITDSGNCIGSINVNALGADCSDNYVNCSKWLTSGSLTGYITLNAANKVEVSLLNKTLCALLTGDSSGPNGSCPVDANGNVTDKGNYCSSPVGPNGCQDSYWLAATFAASAVNINDGSGVADCSGGGSDDSGAPVDSGGD